MDYISPKWTGSDAIAGRRTPAIRARVSTFTRLRPYLARAGSWTAGRPM